MLLPSIFNNNFVDDFIDGFDDMFNFPSFGRFPVSNWMNTNVKDLGDEYQLEVELPGFDKDITASLDKGYLTISATRQESKIKVTKKADIFVENAMAEAKKKLYVGKI